MSVDIMVDYEPPQPDADLYQAYCPKHGNYPPDQDEGCYGCVHDDEIWSENAWLRHAERFDPEAQADLDLFDSLFPEGYQ